ncbi:MAG: hypothetical protein MEP44_02670 [Blastomonas sp.]|nr:hypothetical protein [Blastomonas sp.]
MPPLKRRLRRIPFLRYCALQYVRKERRKLAEIRWTLRYSAFATVGHIAHTWAGIETVLDALIEWYHPIAGQARIQDQVPVSLDGKVQYINKMARDPGFSEEAQAALRAFKIEAKRLGKIRNLILHGIMFRDPKTATGWRLQVREFDKNKSEIVSHYFDNDTLLETLRQMSAFMGVLSPWVAKLIGRVSAR